MAKEDSKNIENKNIVYFGEISFFFLNNALQLQGYFEDGFDFIF